MESTDCTTRVLNGKKQDSISVATEVGDKKLADAFDQADASVTNESQTENGYKVTMLGVISGTDISDNLMTDDDGTRR